METIASMAMHAAQPPRPRAVPCLSQCPPHAPCQCHEQTTTTTTTTTTMTTATTHSSPRSAGLLSPPDSPILDPFSDADIDSLSSFPSVSSSVFFSSAAASPHSHPHSHPHSGQLRHLHLHDHDHDHEYGYGHDHDVGLIIPSLALPPALPRPTAYGQVLGEATFLFVGPLGAGTSALAEFLADAEDVVDAGAWQSLAGGGRVLRASTDWIEERDLHGLERFEGTANISFLELEGFDAAEKPEKVIEDVLRHVHDVFDDVRMQLDNSPASPLLHSLLASSHSTLYTALIYVTATPLTAQDHAIISGLASSIPIIPFSTASSSTALSFARHANVQPKLSFFQPRSHYSLRLGLFRSPQTLSALRAEAADRFMRWREVERAVADMSPLTARSGPMQRRGTITGTINKDWGWSKAAWEVSLSEDIARRMRLIRPHPHRTPESSTEKSECGSTAAADGSGDTVLGRVAPCFAPALDPLHLRSLMVLSLALLAPRRLDAGASASAKAVSASTSTIKSTPTSTSGPASGARDGWGVWRWGLAIMGVFCAGVGIGLAFSS
ncbi:hypothetical protein M0805_003474 [Coniferiporia weirii]|nr:hypothetical protein M0805_003474 [Coniferiporia weirii]